MNRVTVQVLRSQREERLQRAEKATEQRLARWQQVLREVHRVERLAEAQGWSPRKEK